MVIYLSEPDMLARFVDGLKTAAGSAHQLAHAQENPGWLKVRDLLETLIEKGQKMAIAKSPSRTSVINSLDERWKNLQVDNPTLQGLA